MGFRYFQVAVVILIGCLVLAGNAQNAGDPRPPPPPPCPVKVIVECALANFGRNQTGNETSPCPLNRTIECIKAKCPPPPLPPRNMTGGGCNMTGGGFEKIRHCMFHNGMNKTMPSTPPPSGTQIRSGPPMSPCKFLECAIFSFSGKNITLPMCPNNPTGPVARGAIDMIVKTLETVMGTGRNSNNQHSNGRS